jgi:hypothetical protein
MSAEDRARHYAVNGAVIVGAPIAALAVLVLASVPLLLCWLALDFARGWS